jgi:alanine racemase
MRLQRLQGINQCILLNDSWIADFDSLRMALQALKEHAGSLQRTLVLSDLPDSGIAPNELYRRVEELLHDFQITRLIGVGEQINTYFENYSGLKHFFTSTAELIEALPNLHLHKEAVLLKGARVFAFEKVAAVLQLKSHETVLEVNLNNLVSNFNYYRSLLPAHVKWMAMVKAFSYGAGTIEIAAALQTAGVDYLAVAFADEGIELRNGGIHLPIMVMNPEPDALIPIIEHQLEPEIYSTRVLKQFVEALNTRRGFDAERIRIHLKLDTGMHRLGFEEKDFEELISILKSYPEIVIASVFSHLAASAEPEHDTFTKAQINRFESWCEYLQNALNVKFQKHILNSGGIARHPEACFDMVRLGIGLYGIAEGSEQQHILPVGRMTTAVSQLHNVAATETIGYSRRGKLNRKSLIATLPVGYADGISRKLGNGAFCFSVNGCKVPTIGSICMDMCMVDVSEVPVIQEGDKVVIFSTASDLHEMARVMETIPYEVLTHISPRVKRVYLQE